MRLATLSPSQPRDQGMLDPPLHQSGQLHGITASPKRANVAATTTNFVDAVPSSKPLNHQPRHHPLVVSPMPPGNRHIAAASRFETHNHQRHRAGHQKLTATAPLHDSSLTSCYTFRQPSSDVAASRGCLIYHHHLTRAQPPYQWRPTTAVRPPEQQRHQETSAVETPPPRRHRCVAISPHRRRGLSVATAIFFGFAPPRDHQDHRRSTEDEPSQREAPDRSAPAILAPDLRPSTRAGRSATTAIKVTRMPLRQVTLCYCTSHALVSLPVRSALPPHLCAAIGYGFSVERRRGKSKSVPALTMLESWPPTFSTFGWPLEDSISHEQTITYRETETSDSLVPSLPSCLQVENRNSTLFGAIGCGDSSMVRKLHHNASERDRRKRINNLFSSLRSLLPASDQTKRLSIPATVSSVLKYIPELRKEVDELVQKKEELLSRIARQTELVQPEKQRTLATGGSLSAVSAIPLGDGEFAIQISTIKANMAMSSMAIQIVEEDGLLLLNSSSFGSFGGRIFYHLHLQAQGSRDVDIEMLKEKLLLLYKKFPLFLGSRS
ncbi:hypothetical protein RJ639_001636 [Escallonia herrerae]|uniref:BHLH domain-containing protein n=1 Tax=Escallonia herrerae TaxID=1293975 RepID=A0AA88XB34_9ASTE|nr:hypothetical protein RJ639_001636 [Escallonia herrerae]